MSIIGVPYNKLVQEQKDIVEAPLGKHVVLAVPGAGKTSMLAHRVAHISKKHKIKPENTLIFSYTRKAAEMIAHRVCNVIGVDPNGTKGKPQFGTLHSYCYNEVLNYTGKEAGKVINNTIDIQVYEIEIIEEIMKGTYDAVLDAGTISRFKAIITAYGDAIAKTPCGFLIRYIDGQLNTMILEALKEHNVNISGHVITEQINLKNIVSLDSVKEAVRVSGFEMSQTSTAGLNVLAELTSGQLKILNDGIISIMTHDGVFTFNTMLSVYLELITNKMYSEYVERRLENIDYLIIDELQDLKIPELSVIRRLSYLIPHCMMVGDIAQSIYGNEQHEDLANLISDPLFSKATLNRGFRCPKSVTVTSNVLRKNLLENTNTSLQDESYLIPTRSAGKVRVYRYGGYAHQGYYQDIMDDIAIRAMRGVDDSESVCMITRTNNQALALSRTVSKKGYDVSLITGDLRKIPEFARATATALLGVACGRYGFGSQADRVVETLKIESSKILEGIRTNKIKLDGTTNGGTLHMYYAVILGEFLYQVRRSVNPDGKHDYDSLYARTAKIIKSSSNTVGLNSLVLPFPNFMENDTARKLYASIIAPRSQPLIEDSLIKIADIHGQMEKHKGMPLRDAIGTILNRFGISKRHSHFQKLSESVYERVSRYAVNILTMNRSLESAYHSVLSSVDAGKSKLSVSIDDEPKVVVIDTIHSRKGLEYDVVNIVLPEFRIPQLDQMQEMGAEYVAMTRARKRLNIFTYPSPWVTNRSSNRQNTRVFGDILSDERIESLSKSCDFVVTDLNISSDLIPDTVQMVQKKGVGHGVLTA